jgi:hypothetical protein
MNQKTILDNNLPVYFQKYKVDILDSKKESVGRVLYTTVGAIPSNVKNERVWAFKLTGILKPNVDKYHIVYDFSKVESALTVKFKDFVSGTFTICGQVLDATKLIKDSYTYSLKDKTVIIELDTSRLNFRIKKEALFSYQLNINDDACQEILDTNLDTSYSVTINPNDYNPSFAYSCGNQLIINDLCYQVLSAFTIATQNNLQCQGYPNYPCNNDDDIYINRGVADWWCLTSQNTASNPLYVFDGYFLYTFTWEAKLQFSFTKTEIQDCTSFSSKKGIYNVVLPNQRLSVQPFIIQGQCYWQFDFITFGYIPSSCGDNIVITYSTDLVPIKNSCLTSKNTASNPLIISAIDGSKYSTYTFIWLGQYNFSVKKS